MGTNLSSSRHWDRLEGVHGWSGGCYQWHLRLHAAERRHRSPGVSFIRLQCCRCSILWSDIIIWDHDSEINSGTLLLQVPGWLCLHLHCSVLHHQPRREHSPGSVHLCCFLPRHTAARIQDLPPHQEGQPVVVWQKHIYPATLWLNTPLSWIMMLLMLM